MAYKVIIMPPAKRRLDRYVSYTVETLGNRQAAKAIKLSLTECFTNYRIMKEFLQMNFIYGSISLGGNLDMDK